MEIEIDEVGIGLHLIPVSRSSMRGYATYRGLRLLEGVVVNADMSHPRAYSVVLSYVKKSMQNKVRAMSSHERLAFFAATTGGGS